MKQLRNTLLLVLGMALSGAAVQAQDAGRPIRWVVPFPAGSVFDLVARVVSGPMGKALGGATIVIDNKPGAGALIGTEFVAKAPPDGTTMLLSLPNQLIFKLATKDLRFDPAKDLTPVLLLADSPGLFLTNSQMPFNTFQEMVAYAKAHPGTLNYGTSGPQGYPALMFAAVASRHGIQMVGVAFKDGPTAALQATMTNDIQLTVQVEGPATAGIQAGKLKPLLVSGAQRLSTLPNVATASEAGQPEFLSSWFSIHVPAGTPRAVIDRLNKAAVAALQDPEVRNTLTKNGIRILGTTPEEAEKQLAYEQGLYNEIALKAGIRPE